MPSAHRLIITALLLCGGTAAAKAATPALEAEVAASTEAEPLSATTRAHLSAPRAADLIDPRYDPTALVRLSFIHTFSDKRTLALGDGATQVLDSTRADPSPFGHRRGFVLEDVEVGLHGRFNDSGLYYGVKFELVPREKDGNRSSDYLEDAYAGWDRFSFFDVRAGRMKVAFSQANMKSTARRLLPYAPTLDTLIPKRQIGVRVSGGDPHRIARLTAGVFNSSRGAFEQLKSYRQLLLTGRLDLRVDRLLSRLGVAGAGFEWNLGGNAAWVKESFDPRSEHRWLGLDTRLKVWRLLVEAEWVVKDFYTGEVLPTGIEEARRGFGWHVDLNVDVLPGLLDLTVRVEQSDGDDLTRGFDPSLTIDDTSKQKKRWVTVGARVKATSRASCSVSWQRRHELEGYELDNDVVLGMCQYAL